jgi:hypothetical protein
MTDKSCPHCGGSLESGRSSPDHRRFFALINAAFEQWPESADFVPDNSEHLRAWLIAKAGYRESTLIDLPDGATDGMQKLFALSIENAIKAAGAYGFVVPYRAGVAVIKPKSIAWHKLGQREFGKLRDDITDIIEAVIDCKADDLLKERDNAA